MPVGSTRTCTSQQTLFLLPRPRGDSCEAPTHSNPPPSVQPQLRPKLSAVVGRLAVLISRAWAHDPAKSPAAGEVLVGQPSSAKEKAPPFCAWVPILCSLNLRFLSK